MSLQTSYRFFSPIYDVFVARATAGMRKRSLSRLSQSKSARVLISGAGTGLDFPFLFPGHQYTALDLTRAMLARAHNRADKLHLEWVQGDSMRLPFADKSFDRVILHLIVAVVPQPERCLAEAARVLKPRGQILLLDKFLHPGERAWLRRSLNVITSKLVTRLDVVFEDILSGVPELELIADEPAMAGGWFRLIELRKRDT